MVKWIENFMGNLDEIIRGFNPDVFSFCLMVYIAFVFVTVISLCLYSIYAARESGESPNDKKNKDKDKDFYWDKNGYRCNNTYNHSGEKLRNE